MRLVPAALLHAEVGRTPLRSVSSFSFGRGTGVSVADMADSDPRYPRSSIEDDFNYGSCVASASLHIRMGKSPRPSARPGHSGWALLRSASGGGFPASEGGHLPGGARSDSAGLLGVDPPPPSVSSPLSGLRGRAPSFGSLEKARPPLRRGPEGERRCREAWGLLALCSAIATGAPTALTVVCGVGRDR